MRRTYPRSDETFKVLSGHEISVAREMECDSSHINRIKNGQYPDPFSPFREIFRAASNSGTAPAEIWLHDLTAIWIRSRKTDVPTSQIAAKLLEKIQADSESTAQLVEAIADGKLEKRECYEVLAKLAKSEENQKRLKELVLARLGEVTEAEQREVIK